MTIDQTRIEIRMGELGLSKKDLGERCGIKPQNISTIIRRGTCTPKTAVRLAAGLEVPVTTIIRKEGG